MKSSFQVCTFKTDAVRLLDTLDNLATSFLLSVSLMYHILGEKTFLHSLVCRQRPFIAFPLKQGVYKKGVHIYYTSCA